MIKFLGSVRITVGATTSTSGSASIWSPKLSCITALEKAKNIGEFGGCTRISAPTPSTRFPHSEIIPEVRPTIIKTKITWMAMAITLREERSRRAAILPQNIWSSEKFPSKVSFILRFRVLTVSLRFHRSNVESFCGQQPSGRMARKIFLQDEVFNTSVDKFVEKRGNSNANYTILSSLLLFARSEEHTSELQSPDHLVCRLLLEKKKKC